MSTLLPDESKIVLVGEDRPEVKERKTVTPRHVDYALDEEFEKLRVLKRSKTIDRIVSKVWRRKR